MDYRSIVVGFEQNGEIGILLLDLPLSKYTFGILNFGLFVRVRFFTHSW